jgi:hypothetical protein
MRRFLGTVLLAALAAVTLLAAGPASAMSTETRESPPSVWRAVLDLLRPVFGASEGEGSPEWDPDGIAPPPNDGGDDSTDDPGSAETDGRPEWDPNG